MSNQVIGGSLFLHRRIHKATLVSPDHVTENQIDHLCIYKKFRRSLQDVKVRRWADPVASNHYLLTAKLKLKLKRNWKETSTNRIRYTVSLTRDTQTQENYKLNLSNRFNILQDLQEKDTNIEDMWQGLKDTLITTCEEVQQGTGKKNGFQLNHYARCRRGRKKGYSQ